MTVLRGSWPRRMAWALALWFGCGLSRVAPGTVGSLGALPLFLLSRRSGPAAVVVVAMLVVAVGAWAAGVVVRDLKTHDPQIVVIDEVAGTLIALAAAPFTWWGVVVAVALFRAFDIAKPFPCRRLERCPGGWGVILDDVAAGLWAAFVLLLLRHVEVLG